MVKKINIPEDNNIISTPIEEALPDNYLPYAVEVSRERALPDVRDGLKPVQRRIIYGAYMLKAFPDKPYYKSARIVGDILGKYHPHGDSSVYEAMVILAQSFTTREPLIDGHGNWGSQDGDSAAAMRYTEAKLTPIAMEMIRDIDKDVVDMVDNYSNSELEPSVLPGKFPALLVNGTFGIAVGLATNIPPHNLSEVVDATIAYIDDNSISTLKLMDYIKGPDLPTGGIIIGKNSMLSAYETGVGRVTFRSKTSIEKLDSGRLAIVITQFPYRKNKAKLLQYISEMTADRRHARALDAVTDIRDESDRTGIRSVIELKKSADAETADKILKYLFKKTDLQCNVSFNMVAISKGKPQTMPLKTIIMHYIEHQKEVVTRRTKKELEIAQKRYVIIEGFIKAIGIMDEIIKTIRASKSKKDALLNLIEQFGFNEIQGEAILELMLYRLTGLEIVAFEKEYKQLGIFIRKMKKILSSDKELLHIVKNELKELKEKYGNPRRTLIIENEEEARIDIEELIVDEDIIVTLSSDGYLKRVQLKYYNRASLETDEIDYREGDFNKYIINSNTKSTLIVFTTSGNMYQTKGINIPEFKWKEKGVRLDTIIKSLDLSKEKIVAAYSISDFTVQRDILFVTSKGFIKKTALDKFDSSYGKLLALKLKENEKLVLAQIIDRQRQEDFISLESDLGLVFTTLEPKIEAQDRKTFGNVFVEMSKCDEIISAKLTNELNFKTFYVAIDKKGVFKTSDKNNLREKIECLTDTSSKLLIFTDDGMSYTINSAIVQNLGSDGIDIKKLCEIPSDAKILNITNFKNEEKVVLFFTKYGRVKKTLISELVSNPFGILSCKVKEKEDKIIYIGSIDENSNYQCLIVTQNGMSIRFGVDSVNLTGKMASSVVGISLKELDICTYTDLIDEKYENKAELRLITHARDKKSLKLNEIKLQNRAGKGSLIMAPVLNDYIEKVKIVNLK